VSRLRRPDASNRGRRLTARPSRLLSEFQVYALGDPELRAGLAAAYAQGFDGSAAFAALATGFGG
jgi:hypothetical protein